jgi:hypothetical protein
MLQETTSSPQGGISIAAHRDDRHPPDQLFLEAQLEVDAYIMDLMGASGEIVHALIITEGSDSEQVDNFIGEDAFVSPDIDESQQGDWDGIIAHPADHDLQLGAPDLSRRVGRPRVNVVGAVIEAHWRWP